MHAVSLWVMPRASDIASPVDKYPDDLHVTYWLLDSWTQKHKFHFVHLLWLLLGDSYSMHLRVNQQLIVYLYFNIW